MRWARYAIALIGWAGLFIGWAIAVMAEDTPGCIPEPQYPKKCDGLPNPPDAGGDVVSPS